MQARTVTTATLETNATLNPEIFVMRIPSLAPFSPGIAFDDNGLPWSSEMSCSHGHFYLSNSALIAAGKRHTFLQHRDDRHGKLHHRPFMRRRDVRDRGEEKRPKIEPGWNLCARELGINFANSPADDLRISRWSSARGPCIYASSIAIAGTRK